MRAINLTDVDIRLAAQDVRGSMAHAEMLAACGIITAADNAAIQKGLVQIAQEISDSKFNYRPEHEDIHMKI
ncbi:MAG TPA: argininosuccinate lyase, partial [Rhodospirillaceae bacterium]|nr:argininosuccinate lyase [Rhodospirillaceae bacterium]